MKNLLAWMGRHKTLGLLAAILLVSWACDPASDTDSTFAKKAENCAKLRKSLPATYNKRKLAIANFLNDPNSRLAKFEYQLLFHQYLAEYSAAVRDDCPISRMYPSPDDLELAEWEEY